MKFSEIYKRRVLNESFKNWVELFQEDLMDVHKAHLVMLRNQKIISEKTAENIKRAIEILQKDFSIPEEIPEEVEDLYFLFEKQMEKIIGDDAGALHTARSRNDMDNTVFRLFLRKKFLKLMDSLIKLTNTIFEKVESDDGAGLIIQYTHGQPANVSTLGHYLSSFLTDLLEDMEGFLSSIHNLNRSTMGACAITTTGFDIDRKTVSDLLGFDGIVTNSYHAIVTSHWIEYPCMWLKNLMNDITRLAADIGHKASCEVGILEFPDNLVQISSIMPQKRNPVIIEHIRIQAGLAIGILSGLESLMHSSPYQDINELSDAPVKEFYNGLKYIESVLELLDETLENVSVNEQRVREISKSTGTTTTELADYLVRNENLNFRTAHSIVSEFVKSNYDKSKLKEKFEKTTDRKLNLSFDRIDEILSPDNFVKVRKVTGGPAAEGMKPVLTEIKNKLFDITKDINQIHDKITKSDEEREKRFEMI